MLLCYIYDDFYSLSVDGGWTNWTPWSACDKKCGGGKSYRHRTCTNPSQQHGGKRCTGNSNEAVSCNSQGCPGMSPNQLETEPINYTKKIIKKKRRRSHNLVEVQVTILLDFHWSITPQE